MGRVDAGSGLFLHLVPGAGRAGERAGRWLFHGWLAGRRNAVNDGTRLQQGYVGRRRGYQTSGRRDCRHIHNQPGAGARPGVPRPRAGAGVGRAIRQRPNTRAGEPGRGRPGNGDPPHLEAVHVQPAAAGQTGAGQRANPHRLGRTGRAGAGGVRRPLPAGPGRL